MTVTVTPPRASSFATEQKAAPRLWMQEARYGRSDGRVKRLAPEQDRSCDRGEGKIDEL
jgi:hypothetical protein